MITRVFYSFCSFALLAVFFLVLSGCTADTAETGSLTIRAEGEDFARETFETKDGWAIDLEHLYVNLAQITAYQADPPFDPHSGETITAATQVAVPGPIVVDLTEGDGPVFVAEIPDAPTGHYNALSWEMIPGDNGYSMVMTGTAVKDNQTVSFTIQVETAYRYVCGEFVGDERKGFLEANGAADLELTFHLDHIFGDGDKLPDHEVNLGALGFDSLADAATNGRLTMNMAQLQNALSQADYQLLVDILPELGHVGEGHCRSEVP